MSAACSEALSVVTLGFLRLALDFGAGHTSNSMALRSEERHADVQRRRREEGRKVSFALGRGLD